MLIILSPREKCVLSGRKLCFKQSSILTLEKSQELCLVLGERIGKVCAGPWVLGKAILGLRPVTTREDCGSRTDKLSLHCGKAICTAAIMLHQFILCDTWGTSKFY